MLSYSGLIDFLELIKSKQGNRYQHLHHATMNHRMFGYKVANLSL